MCISQHVIFLGMNIINSHFKLIHAPVYPFFTLSCISDSVAWAWVPFAWVKLSSKCFGESPWLVKCLLLICYSSLANIFTGNKFYNTSDLPLMVSGLASDVSRDLSGVMSPPFPDNIFLYILFRDYLSSWYSEMIVWHDFKVETILRSNI